MPDNQPPTIDHDKWLKTRNDIRSKTEDHKSVTLFLVLGMFAIWILGPGDGVRGVMSAVATLIVLLAASSLLHRISLRNSTRKFAPIYDVASGVFGEELSLGELVELIETFEVRVGGKKVTAHVDRASVVVEVARATAPTMSGEHVPDQTLYAGDVRDKHTACPGWSAK